MKFEGQSLGDINGIMANQVPDLDWLAITPEENPVPVQNNPHSVIPQLEAAWGWDQYRNPTTNLVPNTILGGPDIKVVSPEDIEVVTKVTKKAMMQGLKGSELSTYLKDRVASEVLEAAMPELNKLASEQGLLGHVYIDLSPFDTCREAALLLGQNRIKTASFVVGQPAKEASFVDASGNAREIGKQVVASVDYTPALLATYETFLRNAGYIAADQKIASKEDLRVAFMGGPVNEVKEHSAEAVAPKQVNAAEILAAAAIENEEASCKTASDAQWASAKPIVAFMQSEMLAGRVGDALKGSLVSKFASNVVQAHISDISRIASLQGLMGPLYVDVSFYRSAEEAAKSIKTASIRPRYIVASRDDGDNRLERVASMTGCKELPRTGLSVREASAVVRDLELGNMIDSPMAASFNARLASGESTIAVIRDANIASRTYVPEVRQGGMFVASYQGERVEASSDEVDRGSLRTASVAALARGFAISSVEDKVASYLPAGEASSLVRHAMYSMDIVPSKSLEKCATVRYGLNPNSKIAASSKCASCVLAVGGVCAKQGNSLIQQEKEQQVKTASSSLASEYQLQAPKISSITLGGMDTTGIVTPPRMEASFTQSTSLDLFFNA